MLSAGECGVKLWTGDPSLTRVFVPSTYVFSKALARAPPHRISPRLDVVSHQCTVGAAEVIPPLTSPCHNIHRTNVCVLLATVARTPPVCAAHVIPELFVFSCRHVPCYTGIHVCFISAPFCDSTLSHVTSSVHRIQVCVHHPRLCSSRHV